MKHAMAAALSMMLLGGWAQAGMATDVVRFQTNVQVDVDAAGQPVRVVMPEDLPAEVRTFIEQRVRSWQYQSATLAGEPQPATTYIWVNACAVPENGAFRLAANFGGNGPRLQGKSSFAPWPRHPVSAMIGRVEAEMDVVAEFDDHGNVRSSRFENAAFHKDGKPLAISRARLFEPDLKQWLHNVHFDPEIVAGRPVSSQMRFHVVFKLAGNSAAGFHEQLQEEARASAECQAAANAGIVPVAVNPAVRVIAAPQG